MMFFTWEQVETADYAGRGSPPMFTVTLSERELIRLAKIALKAAGHDAHETIEIPENTWGMGDEDDDSM
jgi:hypothetical protein